MAKSRSRRLVYFRIAAVTLGTVLGLSLAYAWLRPHGGPWRYREYDQVLVDADGRRLSDDTGPFKLLYDPYTLFRNLPNQRTARYSIDAHGYRGVGTPRSPDSTRPAIALVGGSTVFGIDLPNDAATIPAALQQLLPDYDILNAGVVAHLSGQELSHIVHYVDRDRPILYVVINGWNDLYDQLNYFHQRHADQFGFNGMYFEVTERLAIMKQGPLESTRLPVDQYFDAIVAAYQENVGRMHAFARGRNARFLLVLQPELGAKPYRTDEEEGHLRLWADRYRYEETKISEYFALLRSRTLDYCRDQGIDAVDLNALAEFSENHATLFIDPVHLNPEGSRNAAGVLAELIRARLAAPDSTPPPSSTP